MTMPSLSHWPHAFAAGIMRYLRHGRRHGIAVPYISQLEASECGAAALAMIMAGYGRWVPLAEVRVACDVSRDGVSAEGVVRAAEANGMQAAKVFADMDELDKLNLPCIVHVDFSHFVVLTGYDSDHVWVTDPAIGELRIKKSEFAKRFTGAVILVLPGDSFRKRKNGIGMIRKSMDFMRDGGWGGFAHLFVAIACAQVLGFFVPFINRVLFDRILPVREWGMLWMSIAVMTAIGFFIALSHILRTAINSDLKYGIDYRMATKAMKHMLGLPLSYFMVRSQGAIVQRMEMVGTIRKKASDMMLDIAFQSSLTIANIFVLFRIAPSTAIVSIVCGIAFVMSVKKMVGIMTSIRQSSISASGSAYGVLMEVHDSMETIHAMGSQRDMLARWFAFACEEGRQAIKIADASNSFYVMKAVLSDGMRLVIIILMAFMIVNGVRTVGDYATILFVAGSLLDGVTSLASSFMAFGDLSASFQAVDDLIKTSPEVLGDKRLDLIRGHIAIKDVSFSYGGKTNVISGVNLEVMRNETIGIIGESGSGKSTIAKLVAALIMPTHGMIEIDGVDARTLDAKWYRQHIGFIMQDTFLFDDTLAFNVALSEDINRERLDMAFATAGLDRVVAKLPNGEWTKIGENGRILSGGEKQRLNIARAVYRQPAIMIMDEATSSLDLASERSIHMALKRLPGTKIIIAHRMATVLDADRIIVMRKGEIAVTGNIHDLLACGDPYIVNMIENAMIGSGLDTGSEASDEA
jgi:ABC-type bacteriocin/lantibiotic exporter with double-glycine peptidase domain